MIMDSKPIEIPFNKTKLSLMLISAMIISYACAWLILQSAVRPTSPFSRFYFGFTVGGFSLLVSGSVIIYLLKKLLDKRPGVIIPCKTLILHKKCSN